MTIRQLPTPCWVTTPRLPGEDTDPHYDTRADALKAIRGAWDVDRAWRYDDGLRVRRREVRFRLSCLRPGAPKPSRKTGRCWIVQCDDGDCGTVIDEDDEGYVVHHVTLAEAEETVAQWEWVYSADGRLVYCEDDAPEDGQVPPLSPAEQEAAGQLVIPGALP